MSDEPISPEEFIKSYEGRDFLEKFEKSLMAINDYYFEEHKSDGDSVFDFFSNGNGPFIVLAPREPKDSADAWQAKLITAFHQAIGDYGIAVHRSILEDEGRRMTPAVVTNHLEEYIINTTSKSDLMNDTLDNFKALCEKL